MTIKDLEEYRYLAADIEGIQLEIQHLYCPVRSPKLDSIGAKGNSVSNPTEATVLKADELYRELEEKLQVLRDRALKIERWINTIEDEQITVAIRWHYLLGASWKETARKVGGNTSWEAFRQRFFRWYENEKEKDTF